MSSILSIILTSCVARHICCFLPMSVSMTFCSRMSEKGQRERQGNEEHNHNSNKEWLLEATAELKKFALQKGISLCDFLLIQTVLHFQYLPLVPLPIQSTPSRGLSSHACSALTLATVSMGFIPEFSASARGMDSRASAKALIAYCSSVDI